MTAQPSDDAQPTDIAHWSAAQHSAVQLAAAALGSKLGAVKVLSSAATGRPDVYVVYCITPLKGSWNVTVNIAAKSVVTITEAFS